MSDREYARRYIKLEAKVGIARANLRTYARMFGRGSTVFSVEQLKHKCQGLIEAEKALKDL